MKKYTIIYLNKVDTLPHMSLLTSEEIKKLVKEKNLTRYDYAIVYGGPIIKTFDSQIALKDL